MTDIKDPKALTEALYAAIGVLASAISDSLYDGKVTLCPTQTKMEGGPIAGCEHRHEALEVRITFVDKEHLKEFGRVSDTPKASVFTEDGLVHEQKLHGKN